MSGRSSSTCSVSRENRAGGACLGECEVDACELEPDFDGHPGNTVIEHRPQTVSPRQRRSGLLLVSPRGARHVPSPRTRARSRRSRRGPPLRRPPVRPVRVAPHRPRLLGWLRGAQAAPARGRPPPQRRRRSPSSMAAVRSSVARSAAPSNACATPRMRRVVDLQILSEENWLNARSASASACSTPFGIMCARRAATQGSIVALPSESGIAEVAPSARASHVSASAGRPVSARTQAP